MPPSLASLSAAVRSRFALRLFLVFSAAVVLPAALLFITGLALFEAAVGESLRLELETSLDRAERDITSFLADLVAASGALATSEELQSALAGTRGEFDSARLLDRSFAAILATLPGRESVGYTLMGEGRIYSSWSRNFRDYGELSDLPLVRAARERAGHVIWQGLSPSLVKDEPNKEYLVTIARAVSADDSSLLGVLLLHADREALRRYFRERRTSASFSALLLVEDRIVLDASYPPIGEDARQALAREAARGEVFEIRAGKRFIAGRSLAGLPAELAGQDWTIAVSYDYSGLERRFSGLRILFAPSFAVLLALALLASYYASRRIVRPLASLSERMEAWNPDAPSLAPVESSSREDEIGALARSFERLENKVGELFTSLQREHEVKELYRYRALRSQLNPHFLFNSLASIRWMAIIKKAENIAEAVDSLSSLLAYSIGREGDRSSLGEEIESVERYLEVQNLRYGGRFSLERRVPEELLGVETLRFMLQPLVENCVVHAYRGASKAGVIEVEARREGRFLVVELGDRGRGLEPSPESGAGRGSMAEAGPESGFTQGSGPRSEALSEEHGSGLGLPNVRDMLSITYGAEASLELLAREGGGAMARIRIPFIRSEGASE